MKKTFIILILIATSFTILVSCKSKNKLCEGEHIYETTVISPSCVDDGYTLHKCKICGYSYKDNYVEALGHTFSNEWSSDDEYHWHSATCSHLNAISDKNEHEWDNGEIILEATEDTMGLKKYKCLICEKEKIVEIPALGENGSEGVWDFFD